MTDEQIDAIWEGIDGKRVIAGENQLNWNRSLRHAFARSVLEHAGVVTPPRVLNALEVLERMDYKPGDRVLVESFIAVLWRRGMWVIDATLHPSGVGEHDA